MQQEVSLEPLCGLFKHLQLSRLPVIQFVLSKLTVPNRNWNISGHIQSFHFVAGMSTLLKMVTIFERFQKVPIMSVLIWEV